MSDINTPFVLFQVLNLALLLVYGVLVVRALRQLREAQMSEVLKFGWTFLIVCVPVFGAVAFLSIRPGLSQPVA